MFFNKYTKIRNAIYRADKLVENMFKSDNIGFITIFGTDLEFRAAKRRLEKRHVEEVKVEELQATEYGLWVVRRDRQNDLTELEQ